jgi:signal transduction histidine kinase
MALKLRAKFSLGIGIIFLIFSVTVSATLYVFLRQDAIKEGKEKANLVDIAATAVGNYVKDTLRPKIYELLPGQFFKEGMSITFVTRQFFNLFLKNRPEYVLKYATPDPRNPLNAPEKKELEIKEHFKGNPKEKLWEGVIERKGEKYYARFSPMWVEEGCLKCHGTPEGCPKAVIDEYGQGGLRRSVGDIMGLKSIAVPLKIAFAKVRTYAIATFLGGLLTLFILFIVVNMLFGTIVIKPLRDMGEFFRDVTSGKRKLGEQLEVKAMDEVGELTASFNSMSRYLQRSRDALNEMTVSTLHNIGNSLNIILNRIASVGEKAKTKIPEYLQNFHDYCTDHLSKDDLNHALKAEPQGQKMLPFVKNNLEALTKNFEDIKEDIKACQESGEDILNIITVQKDYTSVVGFEETLDINAVLDNIIKLQSGILKEAKIEVKKDFARDIEKISIDRSKLMQVFINVMKNAVESILEMKPATPQILVKTLSTPDFIEAWIKDNGVGIPKKDLTKIFSFGFTTKKEKKGSGFGLHYCSNFLNSIGGNIEAHSEGLGKGAEFIIKLPKRKS